MLTAQLLYPRIRAIHQLDGVSDIESQESAVGVVYIRPQVHMARKIKQDQHNIGYPLDLAPQLTSYNSSDWLGNLGIRKT